MDVSNARGSNLRRTIRTSLKHDEKASQKTDQRHAHNKAPYADTHREARTTAVAQSVPEIADWRALWDSSSAAYTS
jgi:hypothetical protein